MDLESDLDIFISDFGESAALKETASSPAVSINVLVDDGWKAVNGAASTDAMIGAKESDLAGISKAAAVITVRGQDYQFKTIEPDGGGLVTCSLKKLPATGAPAPL